MARRRLNKNLVVSLTLMGFGAMIVLSVLMLQQLRQRDPKYFINLAQDYAQKEQWEHAALFYLKAWERSNDASHLVSYGEMLLHQGDVGHAIASWRRALVSQPDLTEAHLRRLEVLLELARLYRKIEDWERVQEAAEAFLDVGAEAAPLAAAVAHNANGLALINLTRRAEDNAERGEAALKSAIELAPEVISYALDLAEYYARLDRIDQSERTYDELIERYSAPGADAARIRLAYARYLSTRERFEEAEDLFTQGLTFAQDEPTALREVRLGHAVFLSQQWARAAVEKPTPPSAEALFDKGEAALKQCIETDPDAFDPYLQLSVLYKSARRHSDVVGICEARLERGFSREGVEGRQNQFNTFLLMIYAAEACVAVAEEAREAGDHDQRETWLQRAEQYVADARGENGSHPYVLSQAGRVMLARGREREALDAFRAADEAYRSYDTINWRDKLLLAQLHLKLNEPGAARTLLEGVTENARRRGILGARYWTLYAQVLFQTGELDRALAISDQILAADPQHADALRLKAAVYERTGRREEAGRIIEALTGDRVVLAILTAQEAGLAGDAEQAVAVLREALQDDPADARLVGAALRELLSLERHEEARAVVETALAVKPDDVRLQRFWVVTRADLSSDDRDRAMLEIIESQEDAYERASALIGFYWRKGDQETTLLAIDEALEHLVARDTPAAQNATITHQRVLLVAKLSVAAALNDTEALDAARDAATKFNVDGAGGESIRGLYHMHRKEYDLAIRAFREAIKTQSTDARSLTYLGQCLQIVGRIGEALLQYERAVQVNPNDGSAHRGLAILAKQRGDTDAYDKQLALCERLIPGDRWVRAELLARQERADPQAAIARRVKLLEENPDDVDNLARLAAMCETVNELEEADDYHARLLTLRPDDMAVTVSAGAYFRRTGRPDRSLELLRSFADSRPTVEEKANAHIHIARHYMSLGKLDLVESTLLSAADMAETFDVTHSLAEFYLHRVDRPKQALPWFDKAAAQAREADLPQLPGVLAARVSCLLHRKLNDIDTARGYVDELQATFPDYPQGRLLESEVLSRMGRMKKAIDALSAYLTEKPNEAQALYQRALHYRVQGRLAPAIEDLQALKRVDPLARKLAPRILLVQLYRQMGRNDLWLHELESLVEDAPNSVWVLEQLVQAYIREERSADAERIITARVNRASAQLDARWLFLRGRIFLGLGQGGKALADFKRGAQFSGYTAESVRQVLGAYLQLGRLAEGIQYYGSYAPTEQATPALISGYARLLAASGRKPEAVELFRRAMGLAVVDSPTARAAVTEDLYAAFVPPADSPSESPAESVEEAIALFVAEPPDTATARRVNQRIVVRLYRAAERYGDAAERLEQLIGTCDDDGERVDLLSALSELHELTADAVRAREVYERILRYDSENWIVLNNLAYVLSDKLGENKLARPYAKRAVAVADNHATLDTLGWIHVGLGDYWAAIAELSRALRLSPGDPLTHFHLGEAYRRSGQFQVAANVLRSGRDLAGGADDPESIAKFTAALERVEQSDRTP